MDPRIIPFCPLFMKISGSHKFFDIKINPGNMVTLYPFMKQRRMFAKYFQKKGFPRFSNNHLGLKIV